MNHTTKKYRLSCRDIRGNVLYTKIITQDTPPTFGQLNSQSTKWSLKYGAHVNVMVEVQS